ncbi:MAG: RecQ family zinc-binding domain-containing protein, partial [Chitinophagaceae bacterium]
RNVYQAVANYLQIPTGAGEGQYYDFDISVFLKKFNFISHQVLYSLKALEQEGWLSFNEQVFLPSFCMFTVNKNSLYEFENANPQLEPYIKTLLRAYEGIFDQTTSISEKMMAGLMKKDVEEIKEQLVQLHKAGIIVYQPQKDTPQLYLLRQRIRTEDITINMAAYNKRKEQFHQKMKQIVSYVKEDAQCRSYIIGSYFGDDKIKPCGICDNCLKQKTNSLTKEEFDTLYHRILDLVKQKSLHTKDLLLQLNGIKKEKAWKVIEFLQAENKIEMDNSGWVRLK